MNSIKILKKESSINNHEKIINKTQQKIKKLNITDDVIFSNIKNDYSLF